MKLKNEANYFVVLSTEFTTRLKFEIRNLGPSIFFNSFLKYSLRPLHLAFAASAANKVNISFTLLAYFPIVGTFQQEFLSHKFHSR